MSSSARRPDRPQLKNPFYPLKGKFMTREEAGKYLDAYYDTKIVFDRKAATCTLTFGDELMVIDLAKIQTPEDLLALTLQLLHRRCMSKDDVRFTARRIGGFKGWTKLKFDFKTGLACEHLRKAREGGS
jgi:hypothetical protein